jgi:hypothetical protein
MSFDTGDDFRYTPRYDWIVDTACGVQKDIVFYEQVVPVRTAPQGGFVRIVDIASSPPQFDR